ncbi:hypothetical protein SFHH103_01687 [Sinorhizobium fredii HH103]|uniref:Uncharacterized protein n=1 Tax=Sinorhizobium fredii (strain HH103) TaxID=1117943 RepID=G9A7F4_SINF1|nr:hypothetical protein [Sinorhizobium fredii]CCE96184.1 hypothetical protein SFHH103_01687 [Sinorhizobium fredii HH103]
MARDTGGPAFPRPAGTNGAAHPADRWDNSGQPGMSLRDWFAGHALIGIMQADMSEEEFTVSPQILARTAYRMADAMLAEREVVHG